jgi:hypothetical protein
MKIVPSEDEGRKKVGPVAAGNRLFWAAGVDFRTSAAGNEYIAVRFTCVEDTVTQGAEVGNEVWENFVLTPKAVWKLQNYAFALKMEEPFDTADENAVRDILTRCPIFIEVGMRDRTMPDGTSVKKPFAVRFAKCFKDIDEVWEKVLVEAEDRHNFFANGGNSSSSYSRRETEVPF